MSHGQAVEVPVRDISGARVSESQLMKLLLAADTIAQVGPSVSGGVYAHANCASSYSLSLDLRMHQKKAAQKGTDLCAVDALSWLPWSEWGQAVSQITAKNEMKPEGQARAAEKLWSAALVLALDAKLPSWPQAQDAHSNRALGLILGPSPGCRGAGRWRDGSFCLVVQPDGHAGLCCSLPLAEPWAAAQMWEFALSKERYPITAAEVEVEVAKPTCICVKASGNSTSAVRSKAELAQLAFSSSAKGLTLRVLHIKSLGWRVLTRLKAAPAALLHLAAHVAVYRVQGAVALSNMALDMVPTSLFTGGRSDWMSTTSDLVVEFVKVFCKSESRSAVLNRMAKRKLLLEACTFLDNLRNETLLGKGFQRFLLALHGSSASRRRSMLEVLLPSRRQQAEFPAIGLSTWLCEVQSDPRTLPSALSLGGGGGFCMASGQGCCRIGVAPVGDSEIVLHVSCFHTTGETTDATAPISSAATQDASATDADEFVDCSEEAVSTDLKQEAQESDKETLGPSKCSKSSNGRGISADAVAQEMERALMDMVHLLQVT